MNPPADDRRADPAARPSTDVAAAAHLLALLRSGGGVRPAKVRRIRQSVRTHTYENDLKLAIAADRVAAELGH